MVTRVDGGPLIPAEPQGEAITVPRPFPPVKAF
jgi:hypothetical protein